MTPMMQEMIFDGLDPPESGLWGFNILVWAALVRGIEAFP